LTNHGELKELLKGDDGLNNQGATTPGGAIAAHYTEQRGFPAPLISTQQVCAARGWLGITQRELADQACVQAATIYRLERGSTASLKTILKVQEALERCGIVFLFEEGHPVGIKIRQRRFPSLPR
jgi:DNA-binding XRE family transcriptional regulator